MNTLLRLGTAVVLLTIFLIGCSQGSGPTVPGTEELQEPRAVRAESSHQLWGLWTFVYQPDINEVEIIPLRDADLHLNALKFLEPPVNLYLKMASPPHVNGNILDIDISITHPFLGLFQYTGFDVCGIIFTNGNATGFNDPDIIMAGKGDARLLNADGYSRWWNPAEFPHGATILNYIDGLMGTPAGSADFNCSINGYKYFADGLEVDDPLSKLDPTMRGMFGAGKIHTRHYKIDMTGGLIFNYAVDASWKKPDGSPPYFPPDCYPPEANKPEAYNVSVTEIYNSLFYDDATSNGGGNIKLQIDVWDHFSGELNRVYGESLSGLPYTSMSAPMGGNEVYSTYELDFNGGNLTHNGPAEILLTIQSEVTGYANILPEDELCSYFIHTIDISSEPPLYLDGWARTWGGTGNDRGYGIEADSLGNLYTTGYFSGYAGSSADFDPSDGEDIHINNGSEDVFLSKIDNDGNFHWAWTWGGSGYDRATGIDIDPSDNIYVTGYFTGVVDFDPGPGVEEVVNDSSRDVFLSKFDSEGSFLWVRTWGGTSNVYSRCVAADNLGNVYVGGEFNGNADFDPGPGVDEHPSTGGSDAFNSKYDSDGNFLWVRCWGGTSSERIYAITTDGAGDIYSAGSFRNTVDFDAGSTIVERFSNGGDDVFVTRYDGSGEFQSVLAWGGPGGDLAEGVTIGVDGSIYVGGNFSSTVDFDPGPGEDNQSSKGQWDIFLTKFFPDEQHDWARVWGSTGNDDCHRISTRGGNVFITGHFVGPCDFDPSTNEDIHYTNGSADFILCKYDSYGNYQWVRTWGASQGDYSRCVTSDNLGNLFITGGFGGSPDFDPGPGVETHTTTGSWDVFLIKMLPSGYW